MDAEIKCVSCHAGAIYDVLVDVRPNSPSFGRWQSFILSDSNQRMLYVPEGVAHGFQSLQDNCRVCYQMSEFYHPELARGIRWNDPALGIRWPIAEPTLSDRDRRLPVLAAIPPGNSIASWLPLSFVSLASLADYMPLVECLP